MLLAVLAVLYAANAPLLKSVEDVAPNGLTSTALVSLRFVAAAVPLLPALLAHLREVPRALAAGTELGIYLWAAYTCQMLGLEKVPASTATVLFALCGLMVQFLELTIDKKPISKGTLLSSLGAIVGLVLFVTAPEPEKESSLFSIMDQLAAAAQHFFAPPPAPHEALLRDVPGEVLVLVATFLFAVHVWRSAALVPQAHGKAGEHSDEGDAGYGLALGAVQLIVCAVLGVALSFVDSNASSAGLLEVLAGLDWNMGLRIFACGALCTGLPQTLELFALKVTPPAEAALIYCTIPVWGTALSVALLHDPLAPQAILGGLLIVACSVPRGEAGEERGTVEDARGGIVQDTAQELQDLVESGSAQAQVQAQTPLQEVSMAQRLEAIPVTHSKDRSHLA